MTRPGRKYRRTEWGSAWLNFLDGVSRWLCLRVHRLRGPPLALPAHGAAVVVCNHVSGLDPLLLLAAGRRPLCFLIAAEQFHRPILRWLFRRTGCVCVDRENDGGGAFYAVLRELRKGRAVAVFPQGQITKTGTVRPLKRGALLLAQRAGAMLFPAKLSGVRGEGEILRAIFMPGNVRLETRPAVRVTRENRAALLKELEAFFHSADG